MLRVAGGEEHFAFNSVLAQLVFGGASFLSPYLYKYLVNPANREKEDLGAMLRSWVPDSLPWVSLYIVFALIAIILFLYVLFTSYPKFQKTADEKAGDSASYWALLKNKWTLLYFLGIFCYVGAEQGVGSWISQFLSQYHGLDPQTTGADTVSYFWALLTVGCLLGLVLLKFMDSRRLLIYATVLTMVALVVALTVQRIWR